MNPCLKELFFSALNTRNWSHPRLKLKNSKPTNGRTPHTAPFNCRIHCHKIQWRLLFWTALKEVRYIHGGRILSACSTGGRGSLCLRISCWGMLDRGCSCPHTLLIDLLLVTGWLAEPRECWTRQAFGLIQQRRSYKLLLRATSGMVLI